MHSEEDGIITLDGPSRLDILDKIDSGTVIFTAHGVSPEVKQRAKEKGLTTIDATCPDVTKTHDLIEAKKAEGYHVIYIGKKIQNQKAQLVSHLISFILSKEPMI